MDMFTGVKSVKTSHISNRSLTFSLSTVRYDSLRLWCKRLCLLSPANPGFAAANAQSQLKSELSEEDDGFGEELVILFTDTLQ